MACIRATAEKEILQKFIHAGLKVLGADFGFTWVRDKNQGVFELIYKTPNTPFYPMQPRKKGRTAKTFKSRTVIFVRDASRDKSLRSDAKQYTQSVVFVPIWYKNYVYGNIILCYKKSHKFTDEDRALCTFIGNSAAQAITIYRLNHSMQDLQSRLATIVESTEDAVLSQTLNGTITTWNAGAQKLYGYSADEIIGQPITLLVPQNRVEEIMNMLRRVGEGVSVKNHESVRKRKDGSLFYVSHSLSPIKNEKGEIIGAGCITRDITRRKIAEEAVKAHDSLLSAVIEGITDVVFVKDLRGRYLIINSAGAESIGATKGQIIGKTAYDLFSSQIADQITDTDRQVLQTGLPLTYDETITVGGIERTYLSTKTVYRNIQGDVIGVLGISHDITERKDAERELIKLSRQKDEFLSIASHELKTPVTTIKGFTQLLQKYLGGKDKNLEGFLRKMNLEIDRLTNLVNDLLDVSRIGAGKLKFRQTEFDINALTNEIIEDIRLAGTRHQIMLDGEINNMAVGDPHRVGQVLTNLIDNAVKYSPNSDKIIIKLGRNGEIAQISVQDFGIGIPDDQKSDIFKRFFQAHGPGSEAFSGLGLGLYISHQIIHQHGGNIWVESEEGKGSIFYFTLPLKK